MRSPVVFLVLSLVVALFGSAQSGFVLTDLVLLALISAVAALLLIGKTARPRSRSRRPLVGRTARPIVVDGSNVMHWKDETPQLSTLQDVIAALVGQGFKPGVVFDANAGYKLGGRYMDDAPLARALNLPPSQVLVVPKGGQADPVILATARELGAPILTNDRFRDWAADYPEVSRAGHLLRGGYRNGVLWLETGD